MLSSVCIGCNDLQTAELFYDKVLGTLDMQRVVKGEHERGYASPDGEVSVWVVLPFNEELATFGNGMQIAFVAPDESAVRAFHAAALKAGGSDEGEPGPRAYQAGYYGAYVRDPTGNKLHVAVRLAV